MSTERKLLSVPGVALAAIAGIVFSAQDARACSSETSAGTGSIAAAACCAVRCQCCTQPVVQPSPRPGSSLRFADRTSPRLARSTLRALSRADGGCLCRSHEPAALSVRSSMRPAKLRSDVGEVRVAGSTYVAPPRSLCLPRAMDSTASPPRSPLYLRVEHLLI